MTDVTASLSDAAMTRPLSVAAFLQQKVNGNWNHYILLSFAY